MNQEIQSPIPAINKPVDEAEGDIKRDTVTSFPPFPFLNLPIDYKIDATVLTVADSEAQSCGNNALVCSIYLF